MKTLEGMGYSNKTGLLTEVVAQNNVNILNAVLDSIQSPDVIDGVNDAIKLLEESKSENPKKDLTVLLRQNDGDIENVRKFLKIRLVYYSVDI